MTQLALHPRPGNTTTLSPSFITLMALTCHFLHKIYASCCVWWEVFFFFLCVCCLLFFPFTTVTIRRRYLKRLSERVRTAEVDASVTGLASHVLLCLQKQRSCVRVLNASSDGLTVLKLTGASTPSFPFFIIEPRAGGWFVCNKAK